MKPFTEEEQKQFWIERRERKKCEFCNADIRYNAIFCSNCGRKLAA